MLITVNGLVIRSYPSGDHDKVIHILTEDKGRLAVMVKGGSSPRTVPVLSCTQLFTYGNYELYRGKGGDLYWYRGGSVLSSFYGLSADVGRMALAAYLCDVTAELAVEEGDAEETGVLLRMLLNSLYVISEGLKPLPTVKAAFELRAVSLMGYMPDLTGCASCHNAYPENAYLDILGGRIVCADCRTKQNRLYGREREREEGERRPIAPVSSSVLAAMRYILSAPDKKLFSFTMKDREEERALARATENFLLHQLERDFETLQFYNSMAD